MSSRERRLFVGLTLLAVVVISRGSQALHGDAPYHLAISASIARDADLDLTNQFDPDGTFVFRQDLTAGFAVPGRGEALYPSQGIGVGALLTPVFLVATGVASALPEGVLEAVRWDRTRSARDLISVALAGLFGWIGVLVLRLCRAAAGEAAPHLVATLIVCLTLPLFGTSILALSELPAAALTLWYALDAVQGRHRTRRLLVLACLPWLHARYTIIVIAGLVWELTRTEPDARRRRVAALVWPIGSLVLLGITELLLFGTLVPGTGVGALPPGRRLSMMVGGLVGQWIDMDFGLLVVAPFWILAIAGARAMRLARPACARFGWWSLAGLAVVAAWTDAWRPAGAPGLVLLPALVVLAPAVASGLTARTIAARVMTAALVGWALLVSSLVVSRPARVWTQAGEGVARIAAAPIVRMAMFGTAERRLARRGLALEPAAFAEQAAVGDLDAVRLYLAAGQRPAVALEAAAAAGHADVVDALMAASAEPSVAWARALVAANTNGHTTVADRLRAAGATIDTSGSSGATALIDAARGGALDEVERLLAFGADVSAATRTGRTALSFTVETDALALAGLLVDAGADVNAEDIDGWTPLMTAVRAGHPDAVAFLIDHGADVNVISRLGWSALMLAAQDGRLDILRSLVDAGADVNAEGIGGLTALVRAAQRGQLDVIRTLLEAGAAPDRVVAGHDAADWARLDGRDEAAAVLEGAR